MIVYASGSGGAVFVPETIERETVKNSIKVSLNNSNSNNNPDKENQS